MKLSKEILEEGITEELVNSLDFKTNGIKVQLVKDGEIVEVLKSGKEFFIILPDGSYQKDQNGYVKASEKDAKIGLARYVLNFQDEYKDFLNSKQSAQEIREANLLEKKIQEEEKHLKKQVDTHLSALITRMGEIYMYSDRSGDSLAKALLSFEEKDYPNQFKAKKEMAEKLIDDDFVNLYERLKDQRDLDDKKDYDSLYQMLFQEGGLPQIASFNIDNIKEISTLQKFFSRDKIEETIEKIQGNSHIRNIAMFNVEKKK